MSEMFQYNAATVNINTDAALATILSRFSEDYIIDVIETSINNRFRLYENASPNIVYAYEEHFKTLTEGFTANTDQITETRRNVYLAIINMICTKCGLLFNNSEDLDLYSAAFYLYDFLVANFTKYIITFYTNYIVYNRESIYKSFNLHGSTAQNVYSKKLFKNPELVAIHANINTVLLGMQAFDIDMDTVLDYVYNDKNIARYISTIVSDVSGEGFFNYNYENYILDPNLNPELQIQIKLMMQNMYSDFNGISEYITN